MDQMLGFFSPFNFYVHFAKMPCYAETLAFTSTHQPVEHTITLLWQPEFSNSRAAWASMAGENTCQAGNNGVELAAPNPPPPAILLKPLLKITSPSISTQALSPTQWQVPSQHHGLNPLNISLNICWFSALPSHCLFLFGHKNPHISFLQALSRLRQEWNGQTGLGWHRNGLQLDQSSGSTWLRGLCIF